MNCPVFWVFEKHPQPKCSGTAREKIFHQQISDNFLWFALYASPEFLRLADGHRWVVLGMLYYRKRCKKRKLSFNRYALKTLETFCRNGEESGYMITSDDVVFDFEIDPYSVKMGSSEGLLGQGTDQRTLSHTGVT